MAKSAKKEEEGAAEAPAKGGKKKLFIIIGAVVLLAGGGGGAAWFFLMKKPPAQEHAAAEPAPAKKAVTFLDMKDMIIGMSGNGQQERPPLMKIKVALEIGDPKVADEVKPLMPRVEDSFQVFMRELRPSDIEGSAGMYRLKEELLRRVNMTVYPAKVDAVLFKELLIQ
ncbi:flagellar basal body-associated protein FliL [Bosea sp. (in: a-proteobacteria)]|uniref:flagellar basal body-associated protein FliL n=1 Tax=Bosea sp. (in: a-proteobacteria) TaxID=1871050 RepID=UPI003B3BAE43